MSPVALHSAGHLEKLADDRSRPGAHAPFRDHFTGVETGLVAHLGRRTDPVVAEEEVEDDGGGDYGNARYPDIKANAFFLQVARYARGRVEAEGASHRTAG
jgi:hypothetical protein